MSMNPNWIRWICASVASHMDEAFKLYDPPLQMFLEGTPRATDNLEDWTELRMNGPCFSSGSEGEWIVEKLEVNIFIQSKFNQQDAYRIYKNIGLVCAAFTQIPVYKLGDQPQDDGTLITCLNLKTSGREELKVIQLGQVTPTTQLVRAMVEGDYSGTGFNEDGT
jgi:hypothetical protein